MSFIKVDSYYTEQRRGGGVSIAGIGLTIKLGDGTHVELLAPFIPVGGGLAVTPVITADGDQAGSVRIDFTRWSPVRLSQQGSGPVRFPMHFAGEATAVKVGRAFDADPNTSWDAPFSEISEWLRTWGPDNGINF